MRHSTHSTVTTACDKTTKTACDIDALLLPSFGITLCHLLLCLNTCQPASTLTVNSIHAAKSASLCGAVAIGQHHSAGAGVSASVSTWFQQQRTGGQDQSHSDCPTRKARSLSITCSLPLLICSSLARRNAGYSDDCYLWRELTRQAIPNRERLLIRPLCWLCQLPCRQHPPV